MKNIIIVISIILTMSCALDQERREENRPHITTTDSKPQRPKTEYIYVDEEGNEITDPELIKEIEDKRQADKEIIDS